MGLFGFFWGGGFQFESSSILPKFILNIILRLFKQYVNFTVVKNNIIVVIIGYNHIQ